MSRQARVPTPVVAQSRYVLGETGRGRLQAVSGNVSATLLTISSAAGREVLEDA
jgi:hypothetical protein